MASRSTSASRFSPEERIGLGVALAAHVALFGWLALDQPGRDLVPPPERMTVSFAEEVAPQSTAPAPLAEAAPDVAPRRGEAVPEPEPEPLPVVRPEPVIQPRVIPTPQPRPVSRAIAKPIPRAVPTRTPPKAAPSAKPTAKPVPKAAAKPAAKSAAAAKPADARARRRPDAPQGASRVGTNFLDGLPGGKATGAAITPPAVKAGPQVAASLSQAIGRELKPHWQQPQGVDVDELITVLAWNLNEDGSLDGSPVLVSQSGVNDANRAQARRHVEQAIKAVRLAAPFDLPIQHYASWRRVKSYRFDWKLSQ